LIDINFFGLFDSFVEIWRRYSIVFRVSYMRSFDPSLFIVTFVSRRRSTYRYGQDVLPVAQQLERLRYGAFRYQISFRSSIFFFLNVSTFSLLDLQCLFDFLRYIFVDVWGSKFVVSFVIYLSDGSWGCRVSFSRRIRLVKTQSLHLLLIRSLMKPSPRLFWGFLMFALRTVSVVIVCPVFYT
jgi:hypothetical protein